MNSYSHNPYSKLDFSNIGHGYRNVCWVPGKMGRFGKAEEGHIVLFGYDKDGNRKTYTFPFCPSVKYEVKHRTQEIDLYGKYVETKYFDDTMARREWIEQMEKSKTRIITAYNPEQEFLLNVFSRFVVGKENDDGFNQQVIRTHFIDIEVAIENEFPEPEFANYPINLITVYDSIDRKFYSWALSTKIRNTITDLPVELRKFDDERSLLHDYLDWHSKNYPDIMTGWNCIDENSDIWMCDRIKKIKSITSGDILVDSEVKHKFPRTYKESYKITLSNGNTIISSKDHIFPVSIKESEKYVCANRLKDGLEDKRLEDIINSVKNGKTAFLKSVNHVNLNEQLTWRKLILNSNEIYGKTYSIENCSGDIDSFIKEKNEITIVISKNSKFKICLDKAIPEDILHVLGLIYTDGTYWKKRKCYTIYNTDTKMLKRVAVCIDKYRHSKRLKKNNIRISDSHGCHRYRFWRNTPIELLRCMIYDDNSNKNINTELLSLLSEKQFFAFMSGLIDGDGCISGQDISICNYIDDIQPISELIRWNGIEVNQSKNTLFISRYSYNYKIRKLLSLWSDKKQKRLSCISFQDRKNTTAKAIKTRIRHYGDFCLLKIENIEKLAEKHYMYDIETTTHYFYANGIKVHNCKFFDMIYIINRMEKILGKDETKKYSPIGKYRTNIEDKKSFGKKFCQIRGISVLDMLFLYRDKFGIKQALDGGYSLDNVASVEIDDAKLHYEGSMLDFYKSNFQKFWEYNVQDVNLVVKLEEKLKLLSIVRKITTFGCAPLESIYTTISYIISSLDIYSRNEFNKVFISYISSDKRGRDADQYEGAFVFPTQAGVYKQGLFVCDYASLYPSTSRAINLSPETLVGVVKKIDDFSSEKCKYKLTYVNYEEVEIDDDQLNSILDEACIMARNGSLFYKHEIKKGIFANWCGNFFNMRKGYKKLLAACNKELTENKDITEDRRKELEINAEYYTATQYALKILINSAYGTLGTTYSPLYDVRLAEAITLTGQFANRSTSKFLNKMFKEKYGAPEEMDVTISGDTDSVTGDMELDVIIDEEMV